MAFSESTIKHLHRLLLAYSAADRWHGGVYKAADGWIGKTNPDNEIVSALLGTVQPYSVLERVTELVTWTDSALRDDTQHPLLVIANFVVEFLKIRPFLDGNGRLVRILTNLLMLRAGYRYVPFASHEHLLEMHDADYWTALQRSHGALSTDHGTIKPWLAFFLDEILLIQAQQAATVATPEAIERLLAVDKLRVPRYRSTVNEIGPD